MTNLFSGSKVLVTGGAGFVGTNLVRALLDLEASNITIIDNLLSSDISNIPSNDVVHFVLGSAGDLRILSKLDDDYDYVFHLSCFHGNQNSIYDPIQDHENNLKPTLALFNSLRDQKSLKAVVYAAAACSVAPKTYDNPLETTEEQPIVLDQDSPYSISKLVGEMYARFYNRSYNLPVVSARFSNVYGPSECLGAGRWRGTESTIWRNVTPTFIWKAINHEPLVLDAGGETTRDFIYVEDLVQGLLRCAENGVPGEAYNLATGIQSSMKTLATVILDYTNSHSPLTLREARTWDRSGKRFASTQKSKQKIGFEASVKLEQGLHLTIDWTYKNIDRIKGFINQHYIYTGKKYEI